MSRAPGPDEELRRLQREHARLEGEVEGLRRRADLGRLFRRMAWTALVALILFVWALSALYDFRAWWSPRGEVSPAPSGGRRS